MGCMTRRLGQNYRPRPPQAANLIDPALPFANRTSLFNDPPTGQELSRPL